MAANSQFSVAVHILAILAKNSGERVTSDCIARSVNTNPVVIRRLLCQLGQAHLVISQTGAAGGTRLAKTPETINLAEVYKAVSPKDIFALHPNTPNQDCPIGKNIEAVLCRLQKEIDKTVEQRLAQHTLLDFFQMIEQNES